MRAGPNKLVCTSQSPRSIEDFNKLGFLSGSWQVADEEPRRGELLGGNDKGNYNWGLSGKWQAWKG